MKGRDRLTGLSGAGFYIVHVVFPIWIGGACRTSVK